MSLKTEYEFTLPRGYVDPRGGVHRTGVMRLATARDELEPLRDPTVIGPDDPRLTVLILARVVQTLGELDMVTAHEIEGLFAADLAFLQDFYGVINFGNQQEYEALLAAQAASAPLTGAAPAATSPTAPWRPTGSRQILTARPGPSRERGSRKFRAVRSDAHVLRYPVDALWQEIAYLAYHLHWPIDDLLDLEHMDRVRMVRAVAGLNERAWEAVREFA